MTKRRHVCDVPGCNRDRPRWQRLCDRCFDALPWLVRRDLIAAKKQGRTADWTRLRKQAASILNLSAAPSGASNRVTAERAFELQARMLGERAEP